MALLTTEQRDALRSAWATEQKDPVAIDKAATSTAIGEIDAWIEAQVIDAFVSMSEPARSGLTNKQKSDLFARIVAKRWEVM